jgi:hypothetical protein
MRSHGSHLKSQSHLFDALKGQALPTGYDHVVYDFSGVEVAGRKLIKAAIREARILTLCSDQRERGTVELRGMSEQVALVAKLVFRAHLHESEQPKEGLRIWMPLYRRYVDPRKQELRDEIVRRDGDCCVWCGLQLGISLLEKELGSTLEPATMDHVITQKDGGGWDVDNLVLACSGCNQTRSATPAGQWLRLCLKRHQAVRVEVVQAAIERMRIQDASRPDRAVVTG